MGRFPQWFDLWEMSALSNRDIDYYIFTDVDRKSKLNVKYIDFSMEEFNSLATEKLGFQIKIEKPYKFCDFKVVYGKIFQDYIKNYAYWAHTDFDLIYGRVSYFLEKYNCEKYDRFLPLGHLAFYKNTEEVNSYYEQYDASPDYKAILQDKRFYGFDELGMVELYVNKKYPFFTNRIFAEINFRFKRLKLNRDDLNYKYQVFYYEDGRIYRAYYENGGIKTEEFIYLHFQTRNLPNHNCMDNSFYITAKGMYPKNYESVSLNIIKKYNPYYGKFYESMELQFSNLKYKVRKKYLSPFKQSLLRLKKSL